MGWEIRMAGRLDEMSQGRLSLRVLAQQDGDLQVCVDFDGIPIEDADGHKAIVEFCSCSGGGGRSPRTRDAIMALFAAILEDNEADPTGIPPYPAGLKESMEKEQCRRRAE